MNKGIRFISTLHCKLVGQSRERHTAIGLLLSRDREEWAQNGAKLSDRKDVKNCQKV